MTAPDQSVKPGQSVKGEFSNGTPSKSLLGGVNLWTIVPTVLILAGMFIYGLRLRTELLSVQAVNDSASASVQKLSRLSKEKMLLSESIQKRKQNEKERFNTAAQAVLSYVGTAAELPIKDGKFVFYKTMKRSNGIDVLFYAPSGSHTLTLDVDCIIGPSSPGGSNSTGVFQLYPRKVFKLPEGTRGHLKVDFANVGEKCIATATLTDIDKRQLDQASYELQKKTAEGGMIGGSFGDNFYLPGDAHWPGFRVYSQGLWHWRKTQKGMETIRIMVSFTSETTFVGIENIMPFLEMDNFDSMFESEIKNNRLILTPTGKEEVRAAISNYPF